MESAKSFSEVLSSSVHRTELDIRWTEVGKFCRLLKGKEKIKIMILKLQVAQQTDIRICG